MKKILIATGVAAMAFAMIASAQGYVFSTNLTVGSTGADVVALQTWLMANGYSIPAIASGAATKGYFGSQTKSAVMAYQAAHGVPNTGFFGPLTRASLNGNASTPGSSMTNVCPAGFVCTPVGSNNPGTPPASNGAIGTPGVAGTLAVALQSTPSNGTSLSKGQEGDVAAYKLQAGASDMQVTSIQLDFNNRLWLYASSVTVLDGSTVVAQKTGLTANDFVDLTAGTQERLTIPMNYVVAHATSKILTIHVAMLPVSDRSSATLGITNAIIRSVDGTGVTDSETLNSTRTWSYTGSNNGQVVVTLDASSPLQNLVQVSTAAQTDNVPLAVYSIKSQNIAGTLRKLVLFVHTNNVGGKGVTDLFGDIKIKINGHIYSADTISTTGTGESNSSSTVSFGTGSTITETLPADQYVQVTVLGKINTDTSNTLDGLAASTTLNSYGTAGATVTNPDVEDQSYTTLAVNATTISSSDQIFSASSAVLSNLTATLGSPITKNNSTTGYNATFSFTVTAGNNTLYVSADPGVALATSTTGGATSTLPLGGVTANPGSLSGDTNVTLTGGYYVIPAGSSRSFTFAGTIDNTNGTSGLKTFSITGFKYGTSSGALTANTINYNLSTLKVSAGL